jgi:CDP-diacylglycerol--glycerol-3-phosphate 3-phosphatidyltransferase
LVIVTDFGKLFDPLADKLINVTALVLITAEATVSKPGWYAVLVLVSTLVIIAREMLSLGFRAFAASEGIVIAADILGKIKTVIQDISIVLLFIDFSPWLNGTFADALIHSTAIVITVAALALTIASGINYFISNKKLTEKISKDV